MPIGTGNKIDVVLSLTDQMSKQLKQSVNKSEKQLSSFASAAKGILAGISITALASEVLSVNREFESLRAQLITVTGSAELASKAFDGIKEFASETPFAVQEVTQAFSKLVTLGLEPSERALTAYGNTAGAMGKSLNQLIEAVADAATGEFERLKDFGIKAKSQGDQVTFTFKGVSTTIAKEATAIQEYLIGLGETEFANGMIRQAETLDGAISNLGDSWANLLDELLDEEAGKGIQALIRGFSAGLDEVRETVIPAFRYGFVEAMGTAEKALISLEAVSQIVWLKIKTAIPRAIESIKQSLGSLASSTADFIAKIFPDTHTRMAELRDWGDGLAASGTASSDLRAEIDAINKSWAEQAKQIDVNVANTHAAMLADTQRRSSLNEVAKALKTKTAEQTKSNKAQKESNDLMKEGKRLHEAMRTPFEIYVDNLAKVNELLHKNAISTEDASRAVAKYTQDFEEAVNKQNKAIDENKEKTKDWGETFDETLFDNIKTMDDFTEAMLTQFKRLAAEAFIEPVSNKVGGFLGDLAGSLFDGFDFGGFFALGGRPPMDKVSIVGEQGPELFVPDRPGTIVPNNQLGGTTVNQNFTIDARGAEAGVEDRIRQAVAEGARQGYQMVANDFATAGPLRRALA